MLSHSKAGWREAVPVATADTLLADDEKTNIKQFLVQQAHKVNCPSVVVGIISITSTVLLERNAK